MNHFFAYETQVDNFDWIFYVTWIYRWVLTGAVNGLVVLVGQQSENDVS